MFTLQICHLVEAAVSMILNVLLLATLVVSKWNKGSSWILSDVCLNAAVQAVKLLQITQLLWWSIGVRRDRNDFVSVFRRFQKYLLHKGQQM